MRRHMRLWVQAGFTAMLIGSPTTWAEEHTVFAQSDLTFEPSELTIAAGDTVTWTNAGGFHNVRADDDSFRCANGCDGDGGDGSPSTDAWSFSLVFTEVGLIPYYCETHGAPKGVGMSGSVDVVSDSIFEDGFESGDTDAWSATSP